MRQELIETRVGPTRCELEHHVTEVEPEVELVASGSGVVHYFYSLESTFIHSFGFRFADGTETPSGVASYEPFDIAVSQDGCITNGGEGGDPGRATIFEIRSPLVPVVNVSSRDNGDAGEFFGSPLTQNPARLR